MDLALNFILTVGITIATIITYRLWQKRDKKNSYFLWLIFIFLLLILIYAFGESNQLNFLTISLFLPVDSVGYIIGPVIFLYIHLTFGKKVRNFYWHFIPFILYLIVVSIPTFYSLFINSSSGAILTYTEWLGKNEYLLQLQVIYLVGYLILSLLLLKKYKEELRDFYSKITDKDLGWLSRFIWGMIGLLLVHLFTEILLYFFPLAYLSESIITTILLVGLISYLGYHSLSQSEVVLEFEHEQKQNISHPLQNVPKIEIEQLEQKLITVLDNEKPYLEEDLTLAQLADKVGISDKKLSALLNHHLGIKFYDLINHHRVEYCKELIRDQKNDQFTLLSLGMTAGFSSKASFNRIFKQETSMSPSKFKKSHTLHKRQ